MRVRTAIGSYQLQVDLLYALFPHGKDQPPLLQNHRARSWVLNELANSYSKSGQPGLAIPLFERNVNSYKKQNEQQYLAVSLGQLATQQLSIDNFQAAETNLLSRIKLARDFEDEETSKAIGHKELGRCFLYRGIWEAAEKELAIALEIDEKTHNTQAQVLIWSYRSVGALLRLQSGESQAQALVLSCAERAFELAEEDTRINSPVESDYVRVHWLLGAAHRINGNLPQSDTHLTDALTRCRTINMVDHEADILLDLARLRADQHQPAEALRLAQEALTITDRSGYVLQGADVHLFLAHQSLAQGDHAQALTHAQLAHRLATCDGGDYTYRVAHDEAAALLAQLTLR